MSGKNLYFLNENFNLEVGMEVGFVVLLCGVDNLLFDNK